ncbi:uncharacterized protein LOC133308373 [Gastrolobium bilobum]|uniref:uncharacterized protein LOC133308373 n=1 Tax=Gastrolobium bilobum TaxID=150636 RepID=UPI002AAF6937|nr:uncharacterized protein LOC133308373 [Gastrolobium bilobum]
MLDMKVPQNKKEVQQLTGRLAALTRFLPKSAENALPLFKLLKKEAIGGWNPECQAAFEKSQKMSRNSTSALKARTMRHSDLVSGCGGRGKHNEYGDAWKVYVDGSSNDKGSGAGIILESPEGVTIEYSLNLGFPTSNNQAEYEALIAGLMQAKEHAAKRVKIFSDSQLVTSQIEGKYQTKGPLLMKYLSKVQEIMAGFDEVQNCGTTKHNSAELRDGYYLDR